MRATLAAVVTSDYHLARAKVLMRRAGYEEGLGVPAPRLIPGSGWRCAAGNTAQSSG